MQKGQDFVSLKNQLEDIQNNSHDYVVPTGSMRITIDDIVNATIEAEKNNPRPVITFKNGNTQKFEFSPWSDQQLAQYVQIPKEYYDRIKIQNPALFAQNVNHGLGVQAANDSATESRLIRTYRGQVRAFLSARYKRLDNIDLLKTILPILIENNFEPASLQLTDKRMYVQAVTPKVTAAVKVGDLVQFGIIISGSDVGAGSVRVEPLIYRLRCTNGMIMNTAMRRFHIGKDVSSDDPYELYQDDTKEATDKAFWLQVRDTVKASMKPEVFEKAVNRLRAAADTPIKNFDIPEVVELTAKAIGISGKETLDSIVANLANGADGAGLTKWGLANAFTAAANNENVKYDDAVELERAGAKVLDLTEAQWKRISS